MITYSNALSATGFRVVIVHLPVEPVRAWRDTSRGVISADKPDSTIYDIEVGKCF